MALQWLPNLVTVTTEQLMAPAEVQYEAPALASAPTPIAAEATQQGMLTAAAQKVLELVDEEARGLVRAAMEAGPPVPSVRYEEGAGEGGIGLVVEVGWPDARVALYLPGEEDSAAQLEEAGWTCLAADADADALIGALKGEA